MLLLPHLGQCQRNVVALRYQAWMALLLVHLHLSLTTEDLLVARNVLRLETLMITGLLLCLLIVPEGLTIDVPYPIQNRIGLRRPRLTVTGHLRLLQLIGLLLGFSTTAVDLLLDLSLRLPTDQQGQVMSIVPLFLLCLVIDRHLQLEAKIDALFR